MKNFIIPAILLLVINNGIFAQNLIAVQNGSAPVFYQQVDSAIINSQDGDTLYIPGGSWNINTPINKRLHIIGVGHHPDSTSATFPTTLNGNILLVSGADHGSLTGIFINGSIYGTYEPVNSYAIPRCRISDQIGSYGSWNNFSFTENVINQLTYTGESSINCSFLNNIIIYGLNDFNNSIFKNNILLCANTIHSNQYSHFENNIFFASPGSIENSVFRNNLFRTAFTFPFNTNVGSNNIVGQGQSSIFVNQEGFTFNYAHDYHLQASCPGINAGTDGTDIGIYGGVFSWKEGSIPFNPHFQSVNISPTTDPSGNLNVNIKVAAQDC